MSHSICSFSQESMLRLNDNGICTKMLFLFEVKGQLNIELLMDGLSWIMVRHEILRSRFRWHKGRAISIVFPLVEAAMVTTRIDMTQNSAPLEEAILAARSEMNVASNLKNGPPISVMIFHIVEREYLLAIFIDHIAGDGISAGIIFRELRRYYRINLKGNELNEISDVNQFQQFSAWQRKWTFGDEGRAQRDYWVKQLDGLGFRPKGGGRAVNVPSILGQYPIHLKESQIEALRIACTKWMITRFMGILVAYALALALLSGERDFIVCNDRANRSRALAQGTIGPIFNPIPLRIRLQERESLGQFIGRIRELCLEGYACEELPFDIIQNEINRYGRDNRSYSRRYNINFSPFNDSSIIWGEDLYFKQIWYLSSEDLPSTVWVSLVLWGNDFEVNGNILYNKKIFSERKIYSFEKNITSFIEMYVDKQDVAIGKLLGNCFE